MTIAVQPQANLLATVAHELRGPLGALETASEILDRDFDFLDQEQVRIMVSSIRRRALWLHGLMENLLCAATNDDGQFRMHLTPLNLLELIDDAALLVEPLLKRRSQRLKVRTTPTVPLVSGDARRLTQVLLNLTSNAAKYAGDHTVIDLTLSLHQGRVRLAVSDRGPGVPAEQVARLFEPYNRAGRTDGEGLGIGLSVVRLIAAAHGGQVGYANRRGGGATFWFELPAIQSSVLANGNAAEKRVG